MVTVVLLSSGCGADPDPATVPEPCPEGVTLDLGRPLRGQQWAEFDAAGGEVFVTVRRFEKGGVLDPEVGRSAVFVGPAAQAPRYDEQSGRVSGALDRTSVVEGTWSALDVPPGRYWLWATNGSDVAVRSCAAGGLSGAAPVP